MCSWIRFSIQLFFNFTKNNTINVMDIFFLWEEQQQKNTKI